MIIVILLASFTFRVSTAPVHPDVLPPLLPQGGATQAPQVQPVETMNQKPQTPVPLSPNVEQAQPGILQQPGLQGGPLFLPSLQQFAWSPLGGNVMMMPLQPGMQESLPANQPATPQQPLVFPPYGYYPLVTSPYMNQMFPPFRFPMLLETPLQQTKENLPPNSPLSPVETPSVAAPLGNAHQPMQQNAQIMYMLQQPMSSPLGSLSSEELEMAAKISQLGAYMPSVLTNLPAGAVQTQLASQAAGLANPEQQGTEPTDRMPSAGLSQTESLTGSRPQPNTDRVPVGVEKAVHDAATVKTPVQPKQGTRVQDCGHRQL